MQSFTHNQMNTIKIIVTRKEIHLSTVMFVFLVQPDTDGMKRFKSRSFQYRRFSFLFEYDFHEVMALINADM